MTIVQAPHPALSQTAKKITRFDKALLTLIKEMTYTLEHTTDPEGVGLAAPQVAESLQLFIVKESPKDVLKVFINPEILELSQEMYPISDKKPDKKKSTKKDAGVKLEGCLSLKDIWGVVHRSSRVKLRFQDETGKEYVRTYTGFLATIIQHECDHLQGILFPKRVLEQKEKLYKATTEKNGEMVFEELSI